MGQEKQIVRALRNLRNYSQEQLIWKKIYL